MVYEVFQFVFLSFLIVAATDDAQNNFKSTINNEVYFKDFGGVSLNPNLQSLFKSKTEFMANIFRKKVEDMKSYNETELIILVDGSSSIGNANFRSEMKYIQKVISDVNLGPSAVRLAVIIYSTDIVTHVNHLESEAAQHEKCSLLHYLLPEVRYIGGSTNTRNAFLEAEKILFHARPNAKKVVFLVTDGFSNKGDPVPVAERLKRNSVIIYTFGIENGNVEELRKTASRPIHEHSYLFKSFSEFEGFERRALHQDLKPGAYFEVKNHSLCDLLCDEPKESGCCSEEAKCSCGMLSGHFACLCPPGYYGTGLRNEGCKLCPNGTYSDGTAPGDDLVCIRCPDKHHITIKSPATSKSDCVCLEGYVSDGEKCKIITCPELQPPVNGYFVKKMCSNVLNAACGIRCDMGFTLFGSSIRICQKNRTWSGTNTSCVAKRCERLKPVPNSNLVCVHEEDNFEVIIRYNSTGDKVKYFVKHLELKKEDKGILKKSKKLQEFDITTNKTIVLNFTVDTQCTFTCLPGYFLVGSKSRNCLPILRWSGLKNTCKAIKCHSLQKIENGTVSPENCTDKGLKHQFGKTCNFVCNPGYELKGPNITSCTGRHGTWSEKNNPSKCIDIEPPKFLCPMNLTVMTDEGVHFATVTLSLPNVTDNSGKEPIIWSKPPFEKEYPLKLIIGVTEIEIYSVDDSGNYAFCTFTVTVKDVENPKILECESPPTFFTNEFPPNSTEIKWKEPIVDDNSGVPIPLSRNPSTFEFPLGITTINYTAMDYSGNNASCTLNITILENPCSERPEITNTHWNCSINSDVVTCNVSCSKGFALLSSFNSTSLTFNCTFIGRKAHWVPDLFSGDMDLFPECSEIETPNEVLGEIIIDASEELCDNLDTLSNDLANEINSGVEIEKFPLIAVCEDEFDEEKKEQEKKEEQLEEITNVIRKKRADVRKKLRIGFSVKGNSRNETSIEKLTNDFKIAEKKLEDFYSRHGGSYLNKSENYSQPLIMTNVRLKCKNGYLLKENFCVKCPKGTFHNLANSTCDPCPIGFYQEVEGQVTCSSCPEGFSTKQIRRKHHKQCKKICPPGTFGKKKLKKGLAVMPCTTCPIGHFQPLRGQTFCEKCPEDFITLKRGSINIQKCVRKADLEDLCFRFHCRNGGTCVISDGVAICKCIQGFLGTFCEKRFNPCESSPCYNSGQCVVTSVTTYKCICPAGFEGVYCEKEIDECSSNPCGSHGECIDLFDSFRCNCFPGFKGESCQDRISLCEELHPCLNFGTCIDVNATYKCLCIEGFTGSHCEEPLDCNLSDSKNCLEKNLITEMPDLDYCKNITCENNMKCEIQGNGQPLCVCNKGFRGKNCSNVINSKVVLHFPKYGVTDYLSSDFPPPDLTEISICVWIQTKDKLNYGTLFSYSTFYDDNAFTLTDYSGLVLYVSGNHAVTDLIANDGFWHFICVTWQSKGGHWQIYLNGFLHTSGSGLSNNSVILGGGKLVIGQEQDFFGGGFNELESFSGRLTYFDIWNRVLKASEIQNLYLNCDEISGNLISWSQLLQNIHGNVLEEDSKFCETCKQNLTLFRGKIVYETLGRLLIAKYECDEGFFLKFEIITDDVLNLDFWNRKCMKYGNWETKEPKCSRISCGFPGYFFNGKILGDSYFYGDIIYYQCEEEYELIGNGSRICQSNGTWSGEAPICRGNSNNCKKLVAPRHGSMFVYFNNKRSYGKSLPLIGDRIEFICDKGYSLQGFGMLTCLNGGIWDREPPKCQEIRCPFPKEASYLLDPNIPNNTTFYYNNSLTITCASKNKKVITCGEFGTWNFSSTSCGKKCFEKPKNPENGYVLYDGRYSFEEGETLFVKCNPGFLLLGDNRIICSENGTWSPLHQIICDSISCGPAPHPPYPYFIAYEEGDRFGNKIFLDCAPEYKKTGEIIIQCGEDGRWTKIQNSCTKITCTPPILPKGYIAKEDRLIYLQKDQIQVKCPIGKTLMNNSVDYIICQNNGQWSKIPDCF